MPRLLVIDDEPSIVWGLTRLAGRMGLEVASASSAEEGLKLAADQRPDAILLDVRLPGMTGLAALPKFRDIAGACPIVIITAYGDLETAVEAIREGAFEYLVKPFDLAAAERTIDRALRAGATAETSAAERSDAEFASAGRPVADGRLIGTSPVFQAVFKQIALVAPTSACVHLRGESGTGKELAARAIHRYSRRAAAPFIPIHVASLNESLIESELFGHVRGAFTGATSTRQGLLEQADDGTVFLDEVAEIPPAIQVKLLRALEQGEVWPVGADRPHLADFRLISATHQNLAEKIAAGTFRQDLYFRLVTFQIDLPSLRERLDDLPELARYFLELATSRNQLPRSEFSSAALDELRCRPWPGNVRELRNAIEHAAIVARGGTIEPWQLPAALSVTEASRSASLDPELAQLVADWAEQTLATAVDGDQVYDRLLRLVEPPLFAAALKQTQGQVSAAARLLGMHRTTLKGKLDESPPTHEGQRSHDDA